MSIRWYEYPTSLNAEMAYHVTMAGIQWFYLSCTARGNGKTYNQVTVTLKFQYSDDTLAPYENWILYRDFTKTGFQKFMRSISARLLAGEDLAEVLRDLNCGEYVIYPVQGCELPPVDEYVPLNVCFTSTLEQERFNRDEIEDWLLAGEPAYIQAVQETFPASVASDDRSEWQKAVDSKFEQFHRPNLLLDEAALYKPAPTAWRKGPARLGKSQRGTPSQIGARDGYNHFHHEYRRQLWRFGRQAATLWGHKQKVLAISNESHAWALILARLEIAILDYKYWAAVREIFRYEGKGASWL